MNCRVAYAPRSLRDLANIESYLMERSPSGARNVLSDIAYVIDLLAFSPKMGTPSGVADLRFQITPRYRYRIVYRLEGDVIDIRRIYHPRQLPEKV